MFAFRLQTAELVAGPVQARQSARILRGQIVILPPGIRRDEGRAEMRSSFRARSQAVHSKVVGSDSSCVKILLMS